MSKIISFRGQLDSDGQEKINLKTIKGKIGYKIIKLQVMPADPGVSQTEHIVKVFNKKQSSVDALVNFDNTELLAAVFVATSNGSNEAYAQSIHTIFDNAITNQNIFITAKELAGGGPSNYYIELEQMTLSELESTMLTLKSLRTITS